MEKLVWYNGKDDLKDSHFIRKVVFMDEQNVSLEDEMDAAGDEKSHHLVLYVNNEPIGTGRILLDNNVCVIGRIAVLKEYRGKHYGKLVMNEIVKKTKELGIKKAELHAQTHALGFYKALGFVEYGEEYLDANIPHMSMYYENN